MGKCLLILLFVLLAVAPFTHARTRDRGFLDRTVSVDGIEYRYQVYLPWEWNDRQKWPIILFLHGAGERGSDGLRQTQVGLGREIRLEPDNYPFVIVMPQCRKGVWWTDPAMEAQALKALSTASKEFHGDPSRTYLTGISMGGYGTWDIAARNPAKFAAIAPICGGIRTPLLIKQNGPAPPEVYLDVAKKIGKTPVWVFHGGSDDVVPVGESRRMVEALKSVNATVKYSEYPSLMHNSWDRAYSEPELPKWFLSHRLGEDDKRDQ